MMNEKELLIQNATNAMPVAQKLFPIEQEIIELESIVNKPQSKIVFAVKILITIMIIPYFKAAVFEFLTKFNFEALIYAVVEIAIIYFMLMRGLIRTSNAQNKLPVLQNQWKQIVQDERLSWLPESYRNGSCAIAIYNYLINRRADSLKEALNLYEADMHHNRMEFAAMLGAYNGAYDGAQY